MKSWQRALLLPWAKQGPNASSLLTNIESYWTLDETSGTRLDSVVATANDLTDNNTVTSAAGKIANAASFANANLESLSHADNASLSSGGSFAFALWVNSTTIASNPGIIAKETDATHREYRLDVFSSRFRWISFSAGGSATVLTLNSFGAPSNGVWYFIVCQYNSASNTLSASVNDGTVDSVSAGANAPTDTTATFRIGSYDPSSSNFGWNGLIDEVGYWKGRTLTAAEITTLYNSGNGRTYPFTGT